MSTTEQIDDEAIAWYLRLKDPSATAEDRERFERWLAQDSRHAEAYEQAQALWQRVDGPARHLAAVADYRPRSPSVRGRAGWQPWLAAAACLLILVVVGLLWRDPGLFDRATADVATAPGVSHRATLADGTQLHLDYDSAVDVDLAGDTRRVTLRRGRIWLDVAAGGRPFVVVGGGARVRVTGTRFGIARGPGAVEVTVEEGRVEVGGEPANDDSSVRVLRRGEQIAVTHGHPGEVHAVDAHVELAWARGLVLLDRARFAEIAAQLERALPGRLLYDAGAFEGVRLSGSFPADRPQALLDALRRAHGIRSEHIPGVGVWLRR
ncbi:FecR domain-containing protein [Aquisalimonas lutea]|uniref:FecR family protein n=1 Tax=Aquisalimonas lutea TaxID=1327750 RepID=UPI0025B41CB2|nr:FecR domain-containing protein [Aquisalimonas lutea]MDN3518488.1 FecR domain-containing protein [Aquisalimonas lutea]